MTHETHSTPSAQSPLPTQQMNALRKLLGQPDFTALQVANLGFKRLQKAEGIGEKGLERIVVWLRSQGYEIRHEPALSKSTKLRRLEKAQALLESNGFIVRPSEKPAHI